MNFKHKYTQKAMRCLWDDTHTIELNGEKYFHDFQVMEIIEDVIKNMMENSEKKK